MSVDDRKLVSAASRRRLRRFAGAARRSGPSERSILTREGFVYFLVSLTLLVAG